MGQHRACGLSRSRDCSASGWPAPARRAAAARARNQAPWCSAGGARGTRRGALPSLPLAAQGHSRPGTPSSASAAFGQLSWELPPPAPGLELQAPFDEPELLCERSRIGPVSVDPRVTSPGVNKRMSRVKKR